MKTRTKILWILGVPTLMLVLAMILLPVLMPEQKLRRVILPRAAHVLGRPVDCGKISLKLGLKGLHLDVRDIELGAEESGYGLTGLDLPRITIHLALRPLLRKEIEVTTLQLVEPRLTVKLPPPGHEQGSKDQAAAPIAVVMAAPDVRIEGGSLAITDDTGLDADIQIKRGQFSTLISESGDIRLSGNLSFTPVQLNLVEQADSESGMATSVIGQRVDLDLELLLRGGAEEIQVNHLNIRLRDLAITSIPPTGGEITVTGEGLNLGLKGVIPLPQPGSPPPAPGAIPVELDLTILPTVVTAPGLAGPVTLTGAHIDGKSARIKIEDLNISAGSSDLKLTGLVTGGLESPLMEMILTSDRIDLADFILPQKPTSTSGGSTVAGSQEQPLLPPLLLPGQLSFKIGKLAAHQTEVTDLTGRVVVEMDQIRVEDLKAALYEGDLSGSLQLQPSPTGGADCRGRFAVNRVQAPSFLAAFTPVSEGIDGILDTDLTFDLQLTSAGEPEDLTLDAELDLEKGALLGIKAIRSICGAVGLPKRDRYELGKVHLPLEVRDDRVITEHLRFPLEGGLIDAGGSTGLDGTLDYRGKWVIGKRALTRLGEDSLLKWLKDEQGDVSVNFILAGTVNSPRITLDTTSLQKKVEEVIREDGEELLKQGTDALKKFFK